METTAATNVAPATPPHASQAEVLKAFNAEAWLLELSANMGIRLDEIPADVREKILACDTKNWVNRKFFDWFQARGSTATEFTPEDTKLFENIVGPRQSQEYRRAKSDLDSNLQNALQYQQNARDYLARAGDVRSKLMSLENKQNHDLTNEIKKIVADGWFKYDSKMTSEYNAVNQRFGIIFTTPTIVCKFFLKKAGLDMDCNLGRFKVIYVPYNNVINVKPFEDNVEIDRIYHPHVNDGIVCWGNADNTYVQAMNNLEPSKAFLALRVILTNYNDESPYRTLEEFMVKRNPALIDCKPLVWTEVGQQWVNWVPNRVRGVIEDQEGEDGDQIYLVRTFNETYEGTLIAQEGEERTRYYQVAIRPEDREEGGPRYTYELISEDSMVEV
jgi:hypothetical protein